MISKTKNVGSLTKEFCAIFIDLGKKQFKSISLLLSLIMKFLLSFVEVLVTGEMMEDGEIHEQLPDQGTLASV